MNYSNMIMPAALLLHGFGGMPFEMQGLARVLEEEGCAVETPLLPGHGQNLQAFRQSRYADWLAAAEEAYLRLASGHGRVMVAGLSMGGSLALDVASRHDAAGVMCIAAPVYLFRLIPYSASDWRIPLIPLVSRFRPVWPAKPRSPDSCRIAPWQGYEDGIALEPLMSFIDGLRRLRRRLGKITAPLLAMQAPDDDTVPADNAWEIARRVSSRRRRVELLPIEERQTGHHCLTTHQETRERVQEAAVAFAREIAGPGD